MVEHILKAIEKINALRKRIGNKPFSGGKLYQTGPVQQLRIEPHLPGNEISAELREHPFFKQVKFVPDELGNYFSLKPRGLANLASTVQFSPSLKHTLQAAGYEFETGEKDNWGLQRNDIYHKDQRVGVIVTRANRDINFVDNIDVTEGHVRTLVKIILGTKMLPTTPKLLPKPRRQT